MMVIGPGLGRTYAPNTTPNPLSKGCLYAWVDWGNVHPYPFGGNFASYGGSYDTIQAPDDYFHHGNLPSGNIIANGSFADGKPFNYIFDTYQPPFIQYDDAGKAKDKRPLAATETGYFTADRSKGISQTVFAKYVPRLFAEYFRQGFVRTYLYELMDELNPSDNFSFGGLVKTDFTPKPAYVALKNLVALLQEKNISPRFTPGSLDFKVIVRPVLNYKEPGSGMVVNYDRTDYVHHLLLQKSDGTFFLLLWHEISDGDIADSHGKDLAGPAREITPPAMPATLTLPTSIKRATVFLPNDGLDGTVVPITDGQVPLEVPDKIMVIKLEGKS